MARSRNIGSIYAELTLKDDGFRKKLSSAGKAAAAFGKKAAVTGTAALTAGVVASGVALAAGTRKTLDQVDALGDMSAQTGIAVADLMKMQRAYEDGGRAANMAGADIAKMQKNLVTAANGGNDPFAQLGLSAKELLTINPASQFSKIGAAIMAIENPAQRTAAAMEIFGKGGRGLLTVFEGLPAAERSLGRMPELAQRFAGAMGEANDLIGHLPVKSDQFFLGFTAGIIGELLPGLQKIDEYDFTTLGENLGNALATAFQGITDGTIWEIFKLNAEKAVINIANSPAMNSFLSSFDAIGNLLSGGSLTDGFVDAYQANESFATSSLDQIDKEISALWDKLEARHQKARSDAASVESAGSKAAPTIQTTVSESPVYIRPLPTTSGADFVNDYQKRGMSLSAATASGTESKLSEQTNIMRDMQAMLSRIVDQYSPSNW